MQNSTRRTRRSSLLRLIPIAIGIAGICLGALVLFTPEGSRSRSKPAPLTHTTLQPRSFVDASGLTVIQSTAEQWDASDSLTEIATHWDHVADRTIEQLKQELTPALKDPRDKAALLTMIATCHLSAGRPEKAYEIFQQCRHDLESNPQWTSAKDQLLSTFIYLQGVASLRRGENENCILCRGESSCILPISPGAVHKSPDGSRTAIRHFHEYLEHFPDDLEVRWLLNLAHMTLGEYPHQVDSRYLIKLDRFMHPEFDIGKFRDISHLVGLNGFNQAGGAIMDDFDNDGLFDLIVTCFDPLRRMTIYRNSGEGSFEECLQSAEIDEQRGGLVCMQADYNNDGLMDIYIPRGAWLRRPIRPSLLRNDGNLRFTDVTAESGLLDPMNSNAAAWADYDNDGWVDLFVACERQRNRLYHNLGNGTFAEVGNAVGLATDGSSFAKGCTWIDYDNDNYPDLFVNYLQGVGQVYQNNRDGTFTNVTTRLGLSGPMQGFSCWAWDYDNDGWLDLFATSYARTLKDLVQDLVGPAKNLSPNKLYKNLGGKRFVDVTREAGLEMALATMGSNYGDFDNDGYLDMYLGTGEPNLSALIPNRMFKNVEGHRFSEITVSAGVGHLQKGHAIACGDWDRDGNIDIFAQMGGAIKGDEYHNILFQNPGHAHHWLSVKLVGVKTNRAALGARIKVVADGEPPLIVHRHISPGSSFGSNPLEQTIGVGKSERVLKLEIYWPTSGTTQVFEDLAVDQMIRVTEFAETYETVHPKSTRSVE